jgi:hypothetical protein
MPLVLDRVGVAAQYIPGDCVEDRDDKAGTHKQRDLSRVKICTQLLQSAASHVLLCT